MKLNLAIAVAVLSGSPAEIGADNAAAKELIESEEELLSEVEAEQELLAEQLEALKELNISGLLAKEPEVTETATAESATNASVSNGEEDPLSLMQLMTTMADEANDRQVGTEEPDAILLSDPMMVQVSEATDELYEQEQGQEELHEQQHEHQLSKHQIHKMEVEEAKHNAKAAKEAKAAHYAQEATGDYHDSWWSPPASSMSMEAQAAVAGGKSGKKGTGKGKGKGGAKSSKVATAQHHVEAAMSVHAAPLHHPAKSAKRSKHAKQEATRLEHSMPLTSKAAGWWGSAAGGSAMQTNVGQSQVASTPPPPMDQATSPVDVTIYTEAPDDEPLDGLPDPDAGSAGVDGPVDIGPNAGGPMLRTPDAKPAAGSDTSDLTAKMSQAEQEVVDILLNGNKPEGYSVPHHQGHNHHNKKENVDALDLGGDRSNEVPMTAGAGSARTPAVVSVCLLASAVAAYAFIA
ncbi:hypothetical protein ACHAWF_010228 [Thalassiosira exigua]